MHYNSFKSRYLRVMLLSLVFLLTAGQASARYIYFKNETSTTWSQINAYLWDGDGGSSSWPGEKMESIGDSWYRIEAGSCKWVIFNDNGTNDANKRTNNVSIPEGKNAFRFKGDGYNNDRGEWDIYDETTWTIVGVAAIVNGDAWTTDTKANDMVKGADGKYTLIVEKTNLAAGDYEYKVAKNHSWDGSFPASGNQTLNIHETGDYTITYTYDGASSLTATAIKKVTKVETPTISPAGGTYHAAQSVTIACATDGATIYYTTDGNDPTTSSNQYNGAIAVNATTTLKAIAAKDGMTASDVASATYTIELPQTGNLYIKVGDGAYTKMDASDGNFTWQGDINNDQLIKFSSNGTDDEAFHFASTTAYDYEVNASFYSNNEVAFGAGNDYIMKWGNGNYTITVPADYSNVTFVQNSVEQTYTIYFKGKESPNAYIWNSDNTSKKNANWPGAAMTKDGDWYKIVLTDADRNDGYNRVIFNHNGDEDKTGNLTIPESLWETGVAYYDTDHWVINPNTGVLYVKFGEDGTYTLMSKDTDGNFTWTGDINNDVVIKFRSKDNSDDNYHLHPSGSGDYWVNETNHNDNLTFGAGSNYLMKWGNGNYTITVPADYSMVSFTKNAGYIENGIPVYPIGVQSETELKKYDFEANPVVYLQCKVLNAERVSPEWQMTKGADGLYHLNGFAMRGTWCHDWDGTKDIEALAFVRVYDADGTHTAGSFKLDKSAYLTNGELYNATFDPETNTLSLTEDETAQGHMPFISLVGNEMKQDQNYTTPRNSHTDSAWQEAWIQYDENGNILKDREGNVMYSTMWPPKNPIYFTANIGGERLYSSEQMTFKVDNNFTAKTGAEWKEQLTGDEYTDLALDDNTNYVRYVVPDIWFVGQAKIWTGWGGQSTDNGGSSIAQWSNHANWGYMNNKNVGTPINAETTYGVSTVDGANGNFRFDNPTYFKTIEFFLNESDRNQSKIYTTLAFGNAQIEAQSHKQGDTYDRGQYKPTVTPDQGVSVLSYIIRCYEAATGKIVALNNGIVAQGDGNPSNANFLNDREGLAEGKYYYEMEVVFQTANGTRTATVKSNPFIIHFPGVYTLEPVAQQLAQMGTNPNGYVSYSTGNEAIYHVTLNAAGEIESIAPVAEGERADLYKNNFDKNDGINWSDKVLVVAPVPAQFKLDAEKAEPAVSLETISTYDVTDNGTHKVVAKRNDGSLAYVANTTNFDSKAFNAVMNYQDITTSADKTTEGKAVTVEMMRPNPKAEAANVTVEKVANTDNITVDGKAVATGYYKVCVNLNFGNANVTANSNQPAFMVYNGTSSKLYTAEAGKSYFTLSYAAVNPNEFSAANIEVAAFYKDKNGNYTLPANIGDPVVANEQVKGFEKKAETEISDFELANVVDKDKANHLYVTKLATATTGNDNINGTDLDVDQYRMRFDVDDQPVAMATYFNSEALNFEIENVNCFNPQDAIELNYSSTAEKATVYIAPMYPVLVNGTMTVNNLVAVTSSAAGAPALKAEPMYIALYGNEAKNEIEATEGGTGGIVTGINDITSKDVQSVRFVNVAGQMSDKPFEGMNIMVTTYTDGTTTTAKVIK